MSCVAGTFKECRCIFPEKMGKMKMQKDVKNGLTIFIRDK
jgi:hypothetical protein